MKTMKLYVKKIWSLHPDEYKYVELPDAVRLYGQYLGTCGGAEDVKDFETWCETEI